MKWNISILLFVVAIQCNAQFSIGTKWTYESKNHPAQVVNCQTYEIIDTTLWMGKTAYVIEPGIDLKGYDYMVVEDNKVYFWDKNIEEYQLNYDFNNNNSYVIKCLAGSDPISYEFVEIIIDSVKTIEINGKNFDIQYCHYESERLINNEYPLEIIKGIGSNYFGVRLEVNYIRDFITEDIQNITYFENDSFQAEFIEKDCERVPVNIEEDYNKKELEIFPNPSNGEITISNNYLDIPFKIYGVTGKLIKNGVTQKGKIKLETKGLLFFKVLINEEWLTSKVINF